MATVVLAGTLDTKGIEYEYAAQCIRQAGVDVITMDLGVLADPEKAADIPAAQVAKAAGVELESIRFAREGSDTRAFALQTMQTGATKILHQLIEEGRCDAVFGMGGSGGTSMLSAAFQDLPTGFPKLIVSTVLDGDVSEIVGVKDLTLMYSVTDIAGLNRISRMILGNAANAVAGMAQHRANLLRQSCSEKPLIALTMFGITTKGVMQIRKKLEEQGFETIIFHCTGGGGRAMEGMIRQGLIDGVIDFTLAELNGHHISKMNDPGPDRLTAATEMGIAQIVVPGAIEVCNFPGIANLPAQYNVPERKPIEHNSLICAVQANEQELQKLGEEIGQKLRTANNRTMLMVPMGGFDTYMMADGPWYSETLPQILWKGIDSQLHGAVQTELLPDNINDVSFTDRVVENFLRIWKEEHTA